MQNTLETIWGNKNYTGERNCSQPFIQLHDVERP